MKREEIRQLSILACVSGLLLVAVFFAGLWSGNPAPDWLPMMISAIGGFELFMFGQSLWLRKVGR